MTTRYLHQRLDAYHLAVELAVVSKEICDSVPRGYRCLADQLIRSGTAIALLIAEGANRRSAAQKCQRFVEAQGECGEAAATVELLARVDLISPEERDAFDALAGRIAAMLTGLIRRQS